ncbi:hypothetical protein B0T11DRAFT_103731 [Plectosphaerella cucumerina]|uniref:Uncharacterized protein n=1 Tax=Plectosphaerella cucumerina TaxID=40658 RepID=A0A8K0X350_9PEZI|nr:hypothetical protein B0T11DRAFT_103731 [Plectosphaerella cucumerina]
MAAALVALQISLVGAVAAYSCAHVGISGRQLVADFGADGVGQHDAGAWRRNQAVAVRLWSPDKYTNEWELILLHPCHSALLPTSAGTMVD